ncbi:C-C motif chemokine 24 [Notamacropus eugenii]|uniref:C-C motif chemokine 24 n=1 Tax=Notamacropus eugenii TaxID=9315 RepID=UPI003B6791F9
MKASTVILLHLLLVVICCPTAFTAGTAVIPSFCCTKYVQKAVPTSLVERYYVTNTSACSMPGVIFITKREKLLCADPTKQWVKDRMKMIDTKEAKKSLGAGPKALKKTLRKPSLNSTTLVH